MGLQYVGYKLRCDQCGRKILVSINLIGVSHNAHVSATCAACLSEIDAEFRRTHPAEAAAIEAWRDAPDGPPADSPEPA